MQARPRRQGPFLAADVIGFRHARVPTQIQTQTPMRTPSSRALGSVASALTYAHACTDACRAKAHAAQRETCVGGGGEGWDNDTCNNISPSISLTLNACWYLPIPATHAPTQLSRVQSHYCLLLPRCVRFSPLCPLTLASYIQQGLLKTPSKLSLSLSLHLHLPLPSSYPAPISLNHIMTSSIDCGIA